MNLDKIKDSNAKSYLTPAEAIDQEVIQDFEKLGYDSKDDMEDAEMIYFESISSDDPYWFEAFPEEEWDKAFVAAWKKWGPQDNMNTKEIKDSGVSNTLYGATIEEYEKAGTVDTVGMGFDYYEFTPEGLAKIAMDQFRDALAAPRLPKKVYQWEQEHNMKEKALKFLKSIGMPDAEYTYCGGVVIYFDDNYDYDEGLKYKILLK